MNFFKQHPVSTKFALSLVTFGVIAVLANSTAVRIIAGVAFFLDIWHFYKSGGAGDL